MPNVLSARHLARIGGGLLFAATSNVPWATLLARTFDVDVKSCRRSPFHRAIEFGETIALDADAEAPSPLAASGVGLKVLLVGGPRADTEVEAVRAPVRVRVRGLHARRRARADPRGARAHAARLTE